MALNLIDVITQEFSSDTVSRIASAIGEPPAATERAIGGVVPAIVGALASMSSTPQGAGDLFRMFQQAVPDTGPAGFGGSLGGNLNNLQTTGASLASSLFGGQLSSIADWIASFAGIKPRSASSLLSLAMPLVFGVIRRQAGSGAFNAGWLSSLLPGQQSFVRAATPAGLASLLGMAGAGVNRAVSAVEPPAAPAAGLGWLKWALPLLALGLIGWGIRGCNEPDVAVNRTVTQSAAALASASTAIVRSIYGLDLGAMVKRSLPNGVELSYPEKGVESQLVAFIQDSNSVVANDRWLTLDRIEFETGSAALRPSAQEQLGNIAGILKAYPGVALKLGGYTDNTGDDAANLRLSQARAANTMSELVRLGVTANRLEAEGFGEQFPVASNDTEEGRQRNRRIDVRVTRK